MAYTVIVNWKYGLRGPKIAPNFHEQLTERDAKEIADIYKCRYDVKNVEIVSK